MVEGTLQGKSHSKGPGSASLCLQCQEWQRQLRGLRWKRILHTALLVCRCGLCERGRHRSSRTYPTACEKWSICLADMGTQGHVVDGFQSAGGLVKGPSTRLSKPGAHVRPLKEEELGPFGELSTSNPGSEVPRGGAGGCAKRVCSWSGRC